MGGGRLVRRQWAAVERRDVPPPKADRFPNGQGGVRASVRDVLAIPGAAAAIERCLGISIHPGLVTMAGTLSLVELAAMQAGVDDAAVTDLDDQLTALERASRLDS